jgi:ABC-type sugar transport system permease subunit
VKPQRCLDPYWMLAPTLLLLGVFFVYPLFVAARGSFYAWDLLTPPREVGLANYTALWQEGQLSRAFGNTLVYSAAVVSGSMALGLSLALLLNREGRIFAFVRGAVFSAYVLSWVAVALLFMLLLDQNGLVSSLTAKLGLGTRSWLGDPAVALYSLAAVSVWKVAGYAMIVFLAGLQDVPPSLLAAAELDGAGAFARFRHITWPLLAPSAAFVGTTSLILSFQAFDVVRIMTQGGPVHATELFVYVIYEQIFMNLRVGRACALVVVMSLLMFGLTFLQLAAWRKRSAA